METIIPTFPPIRVKMELSLNVFWYDKRCDGEFSAWWKHEEDDFQSVTQAARKKKSECFLQESNLWPPVYWSRYLSGQLEHLPVVSIQINSFHGLGLKNEDIHPKCVSCSLAYYTWNEQNFCVISLLELLYRNDRFPSGLVTRWSKVRLPLGVTRIFPSEPHASLTEKSFLVFWIFFPSQHL